MGRALAILALVLTAGLGGCTDEGPKECPAGKTLNPHEERCITEDEACTAWLSGAVGEGEGDVSCQAASDGEAWLDVQISTSHPFSVEVRDGAGEVVFRRDVQVPVSLELEGSAGMWSLSADYDDVAGSGSVVLWG